MRRRQPLPRIWLMTDERMGEALWTALDRLPRGAGIVFRHYGMPPAERRLLFERVRAIARRRRLALVLAATPRQAIAWRADGAHGRSRHRAPHRLIRTAPAHDVRQGRAARADAIFLSPVHATRSHPDARVLGAVRFGMAARALGRRTKVVALGGIDRARFRALVPAGAYGWAAVDAWISD